MEIKAQDRETFSATETELLSLVAEKLKNRVLFPKRTVEAKNFINRVIVNDLCLLKAK